jgi:hypothetical protein
MIVAAPSPRWIRTASGSAGPRGHERSCSASADRRSQAVHRPDLAEEQRWTGFELLTPPATAGLRPSLTRHVVVMDGSHLRPS